MRQPRKRFLYKIWSRYDGFTPTRIPDRRDDRGRLILGWTRYIDVIEAGAEVWVYFYGPHAFRPGVYVKGFVDEIVPKTCKVYLKIREFSTTLPLTDETVTKQVAEAVSQRYRQVFFLPETVLPSVVECTLEDCKHRRCDHCARWHSLPLIEPADLQLPRRLPAFLSGFAPAYWVVPSRCFLWYDGQTVSSAVQVGSDRFYQFKAGDARLAYPLARAVYEQLQQRKMIAFDAVIPIPLSPEKIDAGELNRTLVLARELAGLLGAPVLQALSLRAPISKRRLINAGASMGTFERRYTSLLQVDKRVARCSRVVLIDDVCDHGSTLRCAADALQAMAPEMQIVAVSGGQMILKEAVKERSRLVA